jgi:hypothetical protein
MNELTRHTESASREVESVAYDTAGNPDRGYTVRASYLKNSQHALIEIFKDGKTVREFEYPAYRIYNIAAHFDEIVDQLEEALSDEEKSS